MGRNRRFELKFLIAEDTATTVRDFVRTHLDFDEHSKGRPDYSYEVHDLYLDAEDLALFWSLRSYKERKDRYWLRLRSYDPHAEAPVSFEIKREIHRCCFKQRAVVPTPRVASQLLEAQSLDYQHLLTPASRELVALQNFFQLVEKVRAKPCLRVCFQREAYSSGDEELRLTFDRGINAEAARGRAIQINPLNPSPCYNGKVILEVKFASFFPEWVRHLVLTFGLVECETYKYVESVVQLGLEH